PVLADPAVLHPAQKFLLHRAETVDFGDCVRNHEADIVPVHRILRTGIAEADPELHVISSCAERPSSAGHPFSRGKLGEGRAGASPSSPLPEPAFAQSSLSSSASLTSAGAASLSPSAAASPSAFFSADGA